MCRCCTWRSSGARFLVWCEAINMRPLCGQARDTTADLYLCAFLWLTLLCASLRLT